jgi:excinuclease ABC subunit B
MHGITPTTITRTTAQIMAQTSVLEIKGYDPDSPYAVDEIVTIAAEDEIQYNTIPQIEKAIAKTKKEMEKAARDLDFMEAARLRDEMFSMQKKLEGMK